VYNTSHHALVNLARIRKGESVLIHSAAGGIGHAAISIAKHCGAVIYATAGSEEKRQLVRDMGVEHVYNSRNLSWFDDLMRDTNGQGVDVVLNSLAGKHQRLGVQALRSSGRFLEIGKMVRCVLAVLFGLRFVLIDTLWEWSTDGFSCPHTITPFPLPPTTTTTGHLRQQRPAPAGLPQEHLLLRHRHGPARPRRPGHDRRGACV
jgi:hypothetical protein